MFKQVIKTKRGYAIRRWSLMGYEYWSDEPYWWCSIFSHNATVRPTEKEIKQHYKDCQPKWFWA